MQQNVLKVIDSISEKINSGQCAVFCGAGISFNSGLPLAFPIIKNISEHFISNYNDVDAWNCNMLRKFSSIPFELYIETLENNCDITLLLNMFQKGIPNSNHLLLGNLFIRRYIHTIVTTNFDTLLEQAIEGIDNSRECDYHLLITEKQLETIQSYSKQNKIIKIHGSIEDIQSLRTTIRQISNTNNIVIRKKVLDYLFLNGEHDCVLFLGYSFSDNYDINPLIKSITDSEKTIYNIQHSKDEGISDISESDIFQSYRGCSLHIDTDKLVEILWKKILNDMQEPYRFIKHPSCWEKDFSSFIKLQLNSSSSLYPAMAGLLQKIGCLEESIRAYNKALPQIRGMPLKYISILINKASVLRTLNRLNEALESLMEALHCDIEIEGSEYRIIIYNNLGNLYKDFGRFDIAEKYLLKSISSNRSNQLNYVAKSLTGLGNIYRTCGRLENAYSCHDKAKDIYEEVGDYEGVADSLLNLATVCIDNGELDNVLTYINAAKNRYDALLNSRGVSMCECALGNYYLNANEYSRAKDQYNYCLESNDNDYVDIKYFCLANIGNVYLKEKNYDSALLYYLKAEKVLKNIGNPHYKIMIYKAIKRAYCELGNSKLSRSYNQKISNLLRTIKENTNKQFQ